MENLLFVVVYDHPADFPHKYVARLFCGDRPTEVFTTADTYDGLVEAVPISEKIVFKPSPKDDPVIMETWLRLPGVECIVEREAAG